MTLATVSRYNSNQLGEKSGNAVVIGASMAGLLAARILADRFLEVTVIERDRLASEPVVRRGVPQGAHPHALLEAGRATLEDLFPGYGEDLVSAGGVVVDFASDVRFYSEGDFLARGSTPMKTYSATRPLIEQVVRQHVSELDGVHIRSGCQVTDYFLDDTATVVEGVVVRDGSDRTNVTADLVVDATGRTSRTPTWLENHGYTPPELDEVRIDVAYSTTFIERPAGDLRTFLVPPSAPHTRGGMAAPVEGNRWVVSVHGVHGDHPPADSAGFAKFAASLLTPEVKHLLDGHRQITGNIEQYPFPTNRRYRYGDLDRFPDGLVVIGDAIASFNPIYGQGMSVAALEALVLHHTLAAGDCENLALRFFDQAEEVIDMAWMLAAGSDFAFPQTTGPKPRGTDLISWYLSRLAQKAHTDSTLSSAFFQVLTMERPPTALLRPRSMWRVFKPTS
ncbi:FAD-dependent monooxygenase (plasmid) [Halorussus limi]|uniref:FAD-dependent monooxygenase n=1 Tax=Halorussus limi TaxID=2938695 RepID=A0A8U0I1U9_9EURY|nr:FAD-dependent monooxygenase [Halorussus limi]UPV76896.1 FAD-dependent monooxygenase [Halorussus limi]